MQFINAKVKISTNKKFKNAKKNQKNKEVGNFKENKNSQNVRKC